MAEIKQSTEHREVTLKNWGNSKAIRLTKDILDEAGLIDDYDLTLEVQVEPNKIILTRKKNLTPFQKLFESYNGDKPAAEELWDEVEPVGKEQW